MKSFYEKGRKYNYIMKGVPYYRKSVTINGKRFYFYGDGEKDCLNKIEEAKALASKGMDFDKHDAQLGTTLEYWLYNVKRVDKDIKASTFARYDSAYRNHIKVYTDICRMPMAKISSAKMQSLVTSMFEDEEKTGATIEATVKVWKMFFSWAVDEGYLVKDPTRNLSLPGDRQEEKPIEIFTEEERQTIINYMDETCYEYDTIIKLGFATGMRMGELLALRWDNVSDKDIEVRSSTAIVTHVDAKGNRTRKRENWDPKTKNAYRYIPLLGSTSDMLKEHRQKQKDFFEKNSIADAGFVFTSLAGTQVDASNLRESYAAMLRRAGVPYRKFHTLRHTFATEAIRRGVNVKDLQMLMGHSDISMTYRYVQSDMASKRNAIERMGAII